MTRDVPCVLGDSKHIRYTLTTDKLNMDKCYALRLSAPSGGTLTTGYRYLSNHICIQQNHIITTYIIPGDIVNSSLHYTYQKFTTARHTFVVKQIRRW